MRRAKDGKGNHRQEQYHQCSCHLARVHQVEDNTCRTDRTEQDIQKLARNDFAIVKGIQKRSGCAIEIPPKKTEEGGADREIHFFGDELAVGKGKAWIKERLTVSFAMIFMMLVVSLTHSQ